MRTFLTRSNHCILNFKFLITLLFSLLLITSCYKDEEDDGVLRQLSIDNVEKLATRNQEIYQFSDSILRVYRSLQQQSPYNEQSFTLFLDTHRGTSIHIMDSLVYLLDSINANALHRYRLNKEAYDYAKRTSNLPKGYILDTKFTLDSLDALDLKLKKLISSTLPNIKKQATDFSDKIYRRLSLWYLELQQYLTKAKSAHALFAETITPQKYNDKIFEESTSKKSVYEFLLPFERDSIKSVSRIEAEMFVVDFYLRNKSFPLGQDTTSLIPLSKFERLTTQADNFMAVVKACPTFLQIEKHNTEGKPMAKQLEEDCTFINNNFPNLLLDGKKAVKVIEETRQLFTTDTTSNAKTKEALRDSIMRANTIRFMRSVNIATITSLPNDYAESKLKVLSDLQLKVKEQITKEIEQSKEWIRERVDLLTKLINKEEKLRNKILATPYQSQTSNIIRINPTTLVSLNEYSQDIVDSLKDRMNRHRQEKNKLTNYLQCNSCQPENLAKVTSMEKIDTLTQQLKGAEVTFEMAWLLDSVVDYRAKVETYIEDVITNSSALGIKFTQFKTDLLDYTRKLRIGITTYYEKKPQLYYDEPKPILNELKDIRNLLKEIDKPENTVIAFDPETALEESDNPRKFIYNVSTLPNGKKEMLAINKGEGSNASLNFLSIPISHLPETVPNLKNQTANQVIASLTGIEVEIGDIGTNTIGINNFAVCLNITLTSGHLVQIPLLPTSNNKYVLVPLNDPINNNHNSFWDNAYRDYPNVQHNTCSGVYCAYKGDEVLAYINNTLSSTTQNVKISIYYKEYWNNTDDSKNVKSMKIREIFN